MESNEIFGMVLIIIGIGQLLFGSWEEPTTTETDMGKKGKKGCCGGTKK